MTRSRVITWAVISISILVFGFLCYKAIKAGQTIGQRLPALTEPTINQVLYVRAGVIYEGTANSNIWTKEAFENAKVGFIGKPVLIGHDRVDPYRCVGVVVDADIRYDTSLNKYYIEAILEIYDTKLIRHITQKLASRLSIGFNIFEQVCSIDGKNFLACEHELGYWYKVNDKYVKALGIVKRCELLEVSFINVPACAPAGVLLYSYSPLSLSKSN